MAPDLAGPEPDARPVTLVIGRARILLAEDDQALRCFLAESLRRDGYEVVEAVDGTELLETAAEVYEDRLRYTAPAAIISDVLMPGLTGLQVLASLRHAHWQTPIILITAFGDEQLHDAARRLGADAVFDKPFDLRHLRTIVAHLIASRRPATH